jgi:hypothetical protein
MTHLSIFKNDAHPIAWTGHVRGSPAIWTPADGAAVVAALRAAERRPVSRPVDKLKLARHPRALKAKIGAVTVPDNEPVSVVSGAQSGSIEAENPAADVTAHTEVQSLLVRLGQAMGYDVWIARNDRSRIENQSSTDEFLALKVGLPRQFDDATNRTIELIDVLWLKGHAFVAAFEIESTTSIYSGILRMSDLITMQPNLKISLYIVAPDERRGKVIQEVNRPTFSRLLPPLREICRYIPFSSLRALMAEKADILRYLKPEYLDEISETCDAEAPA